MASRTLVVGAGIVAPLVVGSASLGQITVLPPAAELKWSVNGASSQSASVQGQLLPNGKVLFVHSVTTSEGLVIGVNFTSDVSNNPTASMIGAVTCSNPTSQAHGLDLSFEHPLCPLVPGGTHFGGMVSIVVVTNADGGGVTCLPGADSVWHALVNGEPVHKTFWCPFQMVTSGAGTMQGNKVFGTPIPALAGPDAAETMGTRARFSLTNGEVLTLSSTLVVKSLGAPSPCAGDLNGDGIIDGIDLSDVLAHWGQDGWCVPGDATDDGKIDGADMGKVLSLWGPCDS